LIIVTGARRGIGHAIAKRLETQGFQILAISREKSDFKNQISCDVKSFKDLKRLSEDLLKQKIQVEGIINAAGLASMNLALLTPEETTRNIVETNLLGTMFSSQAFAPLLIRNGSGFIINFSSIAVHQGIKGESIYAATKAGIETYSRILAKELASHQIRVNCFAPGPIDTNLISGVPKNLIKKIIENQAINRMITLEEICDLLELIINPKSQILTGQVLHLGGI
jgi:3-oxoacyl-[acyl-carrier protein] reductase